MSDKIKTILYLILILVICPAAGVYLGNEIYDRWFKEAAKNKYLISYQALLPDGRNATGNHLVNGFAFRESDIPECRRLIGEFLKNTNANVVILNIIKLDN